MEKSCLNCYWGSHTHFGGYDEPPGLQTDCNNDSHDVCDFLESVDSDGEDVDPDFGIKCPGWKEEEPEPSYEDLYYDPPLTPEEEEILMNQVCEAERQKAIELGWLDPETGEPTNAYYIASDFAYDAWRESRL